MDFEKLSYIILGASIGVILNHLYVMRRDRISNINNHLLKISNNLVLLVNLYYECYASCSSFNFDRFQEQKQQFIKLYKETYHLIYFYFDEFQEFYTANFKMIVEYLDEMEVLYSQRLGKDQYNIPRNTVHETIYEDQHLYNIDYFVHELQEYIKYKIKKPLRKINFNNLNENFTIKYNPFKF